MLLHQNEREYSFLSLQLNMFYIILIILHPSFFLFLSFLILRLIWVISRNSWFFIWIGLEINLLSFITLIFYKKRKYRTERALKYFIVQAIRSIIVLTAFLTLNFKITEYVLYTGLIIKIGRAPFHQWVLRIVEGISWSILIIFFILQKINPFFIIFYLTLNTYFLYYFIFCSALLGALGGLNQTSLRKIIVYSSISQISWLLTTLILRLKTSLAYYFIYRILILRTLLFFIKFNIHNLNFIKKTNDIFIFSNLIFLSLGGLPPFLGFLPKLIVLNDLIQQNKFILIYILLNSTFISLFYYLRFFISGLLLFKSKMIFNQKKNYSFYFTTINLVSIFIYPLILYNL